MSYANGFGVAKDENEAALWYRKAADQGWAEAQYNLGAAYFSGNGVPKDYVLAYMWVNLSAANGSDADRATRDKLESLMSREEVEKAQEMCREWISKQPK